MGLARYSGSPTYGNKSHSSRGVDNPRFLGGSLPAGGSHSRMPKGKVRLPLGWKKTFKKGKEFRRKRTSENNISIKEGI